MRMLFNHGLTPEELYSNTRKSITDKHWRWFIARYGSTASRSDAIADLFKYCFGLIINKMIDDKVRFIIPYSVDGYLDFEIVTGDMFEKQRQNGRFYNIDFIESDFTGYFIRYYFKGKAYQKSYPVYLGGCLKQKFLDKINSGEKYYSIKDITIEDFIDPVQQQFSDLSRAEVKRILIHGFRRMHSAMKFGCAISITTSKYINCVAYIGEMSTTPSIQHQQYNLRRDRKLRIIEQWKKSEFDGYYYIGLNDGHFEKWVELNKITRVRVIFENIMPRRIKEELYYKANHIYIFRIKLEKYKGWSFWTPRMVIRNPEFLGETVIHKFIPATKTWKELIKEYEKPIG